jgi:hypothetical protein
MAMYVDGKVAEHIKALAWQGVVKRKDVRGMIRKETAQAKKQVTAAAKAALPNDPRRAYQGVKMVVYKDGNGAMLNILGSKRVKKMAVYKPQRGGRSGIVRRRKVSDATKRRRGYIGKDRAFILRFVNSGTDFRQAETYQNANRGRIKQKEFFGTSADAAMNAAGARLGAKVEKMIGEIGV